METHLPVLLRKNKDNVRNPTPFVRVVNRPLLFVLAVKIRLTYCRCPWCKGPITTHVEGVGSGCHLLALVRDPLLLPTYAMSVRTLLLQIGHELDIFFADCFRQFAAQFPIDADFLFQRLQADISLADITFAC